MSPAVTGPQDRMHAGLNHLALVVDDRAAFVRIRDDAGAHGWRELFADTYPHAGGPEHVVLFIENDEGFEIALVADSSAAGKA